MKLIINTCLCVLWFIQFSFAQSSSICNTLPIITPAVDKPTETAVVSSTCSTMVVSWKGQSGKTYMVQAAYRNPVSGKILDSSKSISAFSCDGSFNCIATLPVVGNTTLSWSVQAISIIGGVTYYSYPAAGASYFDIAACTKSGAKIMVAEAQNNFPSTNDGGLKKEQLLLSNDKLAAFPNPVNSNIHIWWRSAFNGNATIIFTDAAGKVVKKINIKKDAVDYLNQISVEGFSAGLYYIEIQSATGKPIVSKFIKK